MLRPFWSNGGNCWTAINNKKVKKLIILLATFGVGALTFGIYSCSKEDTKKDENLQLPTENRSALPTVINGMLHFDTYADFENYITNLEALETDTNQVKTAYDQLGVDLTQEFLPNLTDYPVALIMEQQIAGFTSARKAEETIINNALNSGDDTVFSIISDPYLKSALNTDKAVHIGTRIFRFFNDEGLAIVLNNNWIIYNAIKTVNYGDLKSTAQIFVSSQNSSEWGDLYYYDSNGKISNEKQVSSLNLDMTVSESPLICLIDSNSIKITQLSNGQMRIEFPTGGGWDVYTWTFSNNTQTFTGNPITVPCIGNGKVFLDIYRNEGLPHHCIGSKTFFCNCGEKKSKKRTEFFPNAGGSGKQIRIDAMIWVKDGEIGCNSKHYGKNIFGIWVPLNLIYNTSGVCAKITGSFVREVSLGNCMTINVPFNEKCLTNGAPNGSIENKISQLGKNFVDPGKLSSGHRLRLRKGNSPLGTFFGLGVDRPRLVLD